MIGRCDRKEYLAPKEITSQPVLERSKAQSLLIALDTMNHKIPVEISAQLSQTVKVINQHLRSNLLAIHLYGSVLNGSLKPYSDIDLLVTVTAPLDDDVRKTLCAELLQISAFPGESQNLRALEVTVLVESDTRPWRHPAKRELQFGEWQRQSILRGIIDPPTTDADLAILISQARQQSIALLGLEAKDFFEQIPKQDLFNAMKNALELWNSCSDWAGDERNVILTLTRIWRSATSCEIVSKEVAAHWAIERLPTHHKPIVKEALLAYLGQGEDRLGSRSDQVDALVHFVKNEASQLLERNRDV